MKSESSKRIAAETVIEMCKTTLDFTSPATLDIREAAMDSISIISCSFLLPSSASELMNDVVNRLRQLQTQFNVILRYSQLVLYDASIAEEHLKLYMSSEPVKDFPAIFRFGEILGMEKQQICELALNHVSRNAQVLESSISYVFHYPTLHLLCFLVPWPNLYQIRLLSFLFCPSSVNSST